MREPIRRLRGLVFPRGVRFLYHEDTFGSSNYWKALLRDIDQASPAYRSAIGALLGRGGIVPATHWDITSGSPLRQKGQLSSTTVCERLLNVGLLERSEIAGLGSCIRLSGPFGSANSDTLRARILTEKILLLAVKDWARRLAIVSYNKVEMRDDSELPPRVGTFAWDLAGPSYLRSIARRNTDGKPKPGFLVCDVVCGEDVGTEAIAAFLRKCDMMAGMRNMPPLLPIFIADRFSREAFNLGRSRGVIVTTPGTLFGKEIATGLAALLQTLTKTAAVAVKRPEVIGELFNKLGHIEGAAGNLRGALFEMLVGHCVVKLDDGTIDIGKKISDLESGIGVEIDVFRVKEDREVWSYECKAHQPSEIIGKAQVEKWLAQKIPLIYRALKHQTRFQNCAVHFEFWTCGSFSEEALALLSKASSNTHKYKIGWKDGSAVRSYAAKVRPKSVGEMLNQHFFRHPISKLNADIDDGSPIIGDIDLKNLIDGNGAAT